MERESCEASLYGPIYKLMSDGFEVQVVGSAAFEAYVRSLRVATIQAGEHFKFATTSEGSNRKLVFASLVPPQKDGINQDFAFHRRREVADFLEPYLCEVRGVTRKTRRVTLPSRIQILSCLESVEEKSAAGVMRTCTRNTQHLLDAVIEALLDGPQRDDLWLDVNPNTRDQGFTHTALFGRIFAEQIRLMEHAIQCDPDRTQVVVDLGCGRGHGIVSLSRSAAKRGLIDRVRFVGIDNSESDLAICREMLASVPGIRMDLLKEDISSKGFADRLRKLDADIVLANHVLEHVWAEDMESGWPISQRLDVLKNRYLHPWLFGARKALSISVPLGDDLETSISDHVRVFTMADLEHLGESMPLRCALAVKTLRLDQTKQGGLCTWVREAARDAFRGPYLLITPRSKQVNSSGASCLTDFAPPFDTSKFGETHRAQKVAEIEDRATFATESGFPHQVRQLLIKVPGSDVRLPNEFAQCVEPVQLIVDHNKAVNPLYEASYGYYNIFRGMTTFSRYRGLSLSPHGDQLQTLLSGYEYPPDWSYIVSTCIPTILFEQAFDVSDAVKRARAGGRVNLYEVFAEQLRFDRARRTENFSIYLLSPYVVHSASEAEEAVFRVFMKVAFSTKRYFDNREYRRNMAFEYADWFEKDTLTYGDGFFHHAHWNECYLAEDVVPSGLMGAGGDQRD